MEGFMDSLRKPFLQLILRMIWYLFWQSRLFQSILAWRCLAEKSILGQVQIFMSSRFLRSLIKRLIKFPQTLTSLEFLFKTFSPLSPTNNTPAIACNG